MEMETDLNKEIPQRWAAMAKDISMTYSEAWKAVLDEQAERVSDAGGEEEG